MCRNIIFLLTCLFCFSCKNAEEKQETFHTICPTDTSIYSFMAYYPNGNFKKTGTFQNMKRIQSWTAWYMDGSIRWQFEYMSANKLALDDDRNLPVLTFETDSLNIGIPVKLRAAELLPFEDLDSSENFSLRRLQEDPEYDYEIIPLKGDSAYFNYTRETVVRNRDYKHILSEYGLTEEEAKKCHLKLYVKTTFNLAKKKLYPARDTIK
jgi:hypothetical protein